MTTPTPVPGPSLSDATTVLDTLTVLPVIALGAILWLAGVVYRKFRR